MGINKLNLKIIAATSMCVFSLFALFSGTIAWFNVTQAATNNANQMGINAVTELEYIKIYRSTSATSEGYTFSETPIQTIFADRANGMPELKFRSDDSEPWASYTSAAMVNMNPDIIVDSVPTEDPFTPLSPYHPLLMVIEYRSELTTTENAATITAETSHAFIAPSVDTNGSALPAEGIRASGNPMSSFIKTYAQGYDSATAVDFSYTTAELSAMQSGAFATLNDSGNPVFNNNPTFFSENTNPVKKVAMIFEYNPTMIDYVYYYYVGETVLDETIATVCDWTLFI